MTIIFLSDFKRSWNFIAFVANLVISIQRQRRREGIFTTVIMHTSRLVILNQKVKPKLSNTIAGDHFLPRQYLTYGILFVLNEQTIPRKIVLCKPFPHHRFGNTMPLAKLQRRLTEQKGDLILSPAIEFQPIPCNTHGYEYLGNCNI